MSLPHPSIKVTLRLGALPSPQLKVGFKVGAILGLDNVSPRLEKLKIVSTLGLGDVHVLDYDSGGFEMDAYLADSCAISPEPFLFLFATNLISLIDVWVAKIS